MTKLLVKAQVALNQFKKDISGASLIEYSLLIGLITVGIVLTIVFVGDWVALQWNGLKADLEAA